MLDDFLLGQHGEGAVLFHLLQLSQTVDTGTHGAEVGQHTAQPAGVDVVTAAAGSLFLDGILSLLLGADKQDVAAISGGVTDEIVGLLQLLNGLLQVDDVDTVTLGVDVGGHFGVPAAGLMTEMHAGLQQLLHRYDSHFDILLLFFPPPRSSRAARFDSKALGSAIPGCVALCVTGQSPCRTIVHDERGFCKYYFQKI